MTVQREAVTVANEAKEVPNERTGVPPEVRAWDEAIMASKIDSRQSPEEALADLKLLEAMVKSGEQNGQPVPLTYQTTT